MFISCRNQSVINVKKTYNELQIKLYVHDFFPAFVTVIAVTVFISFQSAEFSTIRTFMVFHFDSIIYSSHSKALNHAYPLEQKPVYNIDSSMRNFNILL